MSEKIEMRLADKSDCVLLSRIAAESWIWENRGILSDELLSSMTETHWIGMFRNGLALKKIRCILGYVEEVPVGLVSYGIPGGSFTSPGSAKPVRGSNPRMEGEIKALYVLPSYFGMGYGTALLRTAIADLGAVGCERCSLTVSADNDRAMALYKTERFIITGKSSSKMPDGAVVREYIMTKRLI